jgi:hypothetical protein
MPVAATPTITEQLNTINKPTDKARSFIRAALALRANVAPRPATALIAGATPSAPPVRPAYTKSAGLPANFEAVALFPSADAASTNFKIELPYSPAVLAHSLDMRASLVPISAAPLILKPLAGAVALTAPVDIAERYIYDLAIALGATAATKIYAATGLSVVVLTGSIAGQTFADLLLDTAPGGGGGGNA